MGVFCLHILFLYPNRESSNTARGVRPAEHRSNATFTVQHPLTSSGYVMATISLGRWKLNVESFMNHFRIHFTWIWGGFYFVFNLGKDGQNQRAVSNLALSLKNRVSKAPFSEKCTQKIPRLNPFWLPFRLTFAVASYRCLTWISLWTLMTGEIFLTFFVRTRWAQPKS